MGKLIVGIILILIGISALTGISFVHFIVAIVLITIGVRIIIGRSLSGSQWRWHNHKTTSHEDQINEVIVFSPLEKTYISESFTGGKLVAVFSSAEIDLTQVKPVGSEVHLEINSVFSSVEITIPKDWKIRSQAAAFMGGIDTHQAQAGDGAVTLNLGGQATFGEIEVRN